MLIKAIIIFYCIYTRMAKIKMYWQGYGASATLLYCWWECILENCLAVSVKAKHMPAP